MPPGWLDRVLLELLIERERHGYELSAAVVRAADTETRTAVAEGTVYPALRRLERGGLLLGRWVEVVEGAPRRRYYSLTPEGRRVSSKLTSKRAIADAPSLSAARS